MASNLAQASPPLGGQSNDGLGEARGRRPSSLGSLSLVCTIGFRSAEGGEMELPDSESVCACVRVCVCLPVSPWTWSS